MGSKSGLLDVIASHQDVSHYQELLWEGSYAEYLELVQSDPLITRNAYQRLFDLIESHGHTEYTEYKKKHPPLQLLRRPVRGWSGRGCTASTCS